MHKMSSKQAIHVKGVIQDIEFSENLFSNSVVECQKSHQMTTFLFKMMNFLLKRSYYFLNTHFE